MFFQLKKLNNESGIVLFIVLMTAIIIMIFSVGILTQSVNEINYAQQQIDQIASEELSKGVFWNTYSSIDSQYIVAPGTLPTQQIGGRSYQINMQLNGSSEGVNSYNVDVSYNAF